MATQRAFQQPASTLPGMPPLTSIPENQSSASASAARPSDPPSSSSESATWDAWCELQESASNFHRAYRSQQFSMSPAKASSADKQWRLSPAFATKRCTSALRYQTPVFFFLFCTQRVVRRNEEECRMPCAEHSANARLTVLHALHRHVGSSCNQRRGSV